MLQGKFVICRGSGLMIEVEEQTHLPTVVSLESTHLCRLIHMLHFSTVRQELS